MEKLLKSKFLPLLPIALGGGAVGLRTLVYRLAMDEKGLLTPNHPAEIALWLLCLASAGLIVAVTARMKGAVDYGANFPPSLTGALGHFLFGAAILLTVLIQAPETEGAMGRAWLWLGCTATAALVWAGLCRLGEKPPCFLSHLLVCVFIGIHLVSHYRTWSSTAQILEYLFSLLGGQTLLFFAYYLTGFDVGMGKRRKQLTMGLMSLFLCTVALAETRFWLLYLGGMVWVICDLCALNQVPREKVEA